ncbi:hypothetical protein KIH39_08155 [Telmatocola sphagniphila]|uniref:Uncharacterized protein n=1 Tax=Telmatocola sphagniphila TaxID=1123043 RepID=A0A8E6EWD0_9BACT|nr:hypothetical protein [Telmatocola sphagniphila]QVL33865.1 hypothetical protein KIH39_08155 [Telmatocola sphagniphila]
MGKCVNGPGVESSERVFTHKIVSPQPGEATPSLGWPVIIHWKVRKKTGGAWERSYPASVDLRLDHRSWRISVGPEPPGGVHKVDRRESEVLEFAEDCCGRILAFTRY